MLRKVSKNKTFQIHEDIFKIFHLFILYLNIFEKINNLLLHTLSCFDLNAVFKISLKSMRKIARLRKLKTYIYIEENRGLPWLIIF